MATISSRSPITVRIHPFDSPEAQHLVSALDAELVSLYHDYLHLVDPAVCGNPVPSSELGAQAATGISSGNTRSAEAPEANGLNFFVAFGPSTTTQATEAVGCIALRSLTTEQYPLLFPSHPNSSSLKVGELKRLFVLSSYRSSGVAAKLYSAAEAFARDELHMDVLVVETGIRNSGASKLYERNGFVRRRDWGVNGDAAVEKGGVSLWLEKWINEKMADGVEHQN